MKNGSLLGVTLIVLCTPASIQAATATNVELAEVGTDEAVIYIALDSIGEDVEVRFGETTPDTEADLEATGGRWFRAGMSGLTPGSHYVYEILVGGEALPASEYNPGQFTTLAEPGVLLFSFAVITDTHVGEDVAGLVGGGLYEGYSWPDPDSPYWKFTNAAVVAEVNESDVAFVIHNGDLTSGAKEEEFQEASVLFDAMNKPTYFVRGNHDRPGDGPDYFAQWVGYEPAWTSFEFQGQTFALLDSVLPDSGWPDITEEQLGWFEALADAAAEDERPMWVFLHHPASEQGEFIFTLLPPVQETFLGLVARGAPLVPAVFSGHSHRNRVLSSDIAPGVSFVETAATKEYPGSWTEVRVYDQGWLEWTHRIDCPECIEWYDLTTGMYDGKAQGIKLGSLEERCFVVPFAPKVIQAVADSQQPSPESEEVDVQNKSDSAGTGVAKPTPSGSSGGCQSVRPPGAAGGASGLLLLLATLAMLAVSQRKARR